MGITKCHQKNRKSPYGIKWEIKGKRRFKFFVTEKERDIFFNEFAKQERKLGNSLLELSAEEASTIKECLKIVDSCYEVISACREYAAKHNLRPILFHEAIAEYLHEKMTLGREENYYRSNHNILDRAGDYLPERLGKWTNDNCRNMALELAKNFEPVTVRNNVKVMRAFCNWCIDKNYLNSNLFKNAPIPKIITKEVEFLKIEDVRKLFKAAVNNHPEAVAYMALNCFAGLRSSACARLDIKSIDFKQKGFNIKAKIAKNERRVYLDGHETNLWAWLEWARKNAPKGFALTKRQWDEVRSKTAISADVKMPHNAFRHTFCTYHVALYGDAGKTATQLTHRGNVSILYDRYKGNATNAAAKEFFNILPENV